MQMTFEDQLNAVIYFHLEDHTSGKHLIHTLKEDDFVREEIAPEKNIEKNSFFKAIRSTGLERLIQVLNYRNYRVESRTTSRVVQWRPPNIV